MWIKKSLCVSENMISSFKFSELTSWPRDLVTLPMQSVRLMKANHSISLNQS